MEIIRFEQAKLITEQRYLFQNYEMRFHEVLRLFTKSPFIQMTAFDLWSEIIDLSDSYSEKDYSKLLLKKTDEIFKKVEDLQTNPKFNNVKQGIIDMIKLCNEKGIELN